MAFLNLSPKPPILASALILALLLSLNLYTALAASGGVAGGRGSSSGSSSSSSSSSTFFYGHGPSGNGRKMGTGEFIFVIVIVGIVVAIFVVLVVRDCCKSEKRSVLTLQVGLLGNARSLQRDLNELAKTADTSTKKGLHYILREAVTSLLDHPRYCVSGYSSVDEKWGTEDVERHFNLLSNNERGKFDIESLVSINNVNVQRTYVPKAEYIVVTILVAAEGAYILPAIESTADLKEALLYLFRFCPNKILAVQVLWTPQAEDDTLSEEELHANYPLLRPMRY